MRFVLNEPTNEKIEGYLDTSIGRTHGSSGRNIDLNAMLNIPLSESLAVRFSAGIVDNAGVVDYSNVYASDGNGVPISDAFGVAYGGPVYILSLIHI